VLAIVPRLLLVSSLTSGRHIGGELVAAAKLLAIYSVVIVAVKVRHERVGMTVAVLAVLPLAAALSRGEWFQVAILPATVVLAVSVGD